MKLGQSDGKGTDELFSILRRTGRCRFLLTFGPCA